MMAAVIDGASVRGMLPSLAAHLSKQGYDSTPAVWATAVVRRALYRSFTTKPPPLPLDALLAANTALWSALKMIPSMAEVYTLLQRRPAEPLPDALAEHTGPLATELRDVFAALFPTKRWHLLDTRYLRLLLPACVTTLVRLNLSSGHFEFAHVGDTALILVNADGQIDVLSQDQMGAFDDATLRIAYEAIRQHDQIDTVAQAIQMVQAIREADLLNGLRHNYVDTSGYTHSDEGCGVVNGLEEINDYVQTGEGQLGHGERLYLMSDGLTLPLSAPRETPPPAVRDSLARWKQALVEGDVPALLKHLQDILAADVSRNIFPRIKHSDDATALMISLL